MNTAPIRTGAPRITRRRVAAFAGASLLALSFVGVAVPFLVGGQAWGASIGMGAFVAAWGGLGFGVMIGGVVWATQVERAAQRERVEGRTLPPALVQPAHPNDQAGQAIGRRPDVEPGQAALDVAS